MNDYFLDYLSYLSFSIIAARLDYFKLARNFIRSGRIVEKDRTKNKTTIV